MRKQKILLAFQAVKQLLKLDENNPDSHRCLCTVTRPEAGANAADFDDDDGGGLSLNAQSRAMLMQKLDRTGTTSSIAESLSVPLLNGAAPPQALSFPVNGQSAFPVVVPMLLPSPFPVHIGEPSECLLLKNMFDPSTEVINDGFGIVEGLMITVHPIIATQKIC